jgi:uncharacterized membrane protein YozB (DUF420 family)
MLPTLNAALNGLSALLLAAGFVLIRRGHIRAHRACMLAAFGTSTLFLISYLVYHVQAGATPFVGQGLVRPIYYSLLISHIVLAAFVVPLAITVLYRGLTGRFFKHRRLARWVLPVWLYVALTGLVVYLMLYHLYPSPRTIVAQ